MFFVMAGWWRRKEMRGRTVETAGGTAEKMHGGNGFLPREGRGEQQGFQANEKGERRDLRARGLARPESAMRRGEILGRGGPPGGGDGQGGRGKRVPQR